MDGWRGKLGLRAGDNGPRSGLGAACCVLARQVASSGFAAWDIIGIIIIGITIIGITTMGNITIRTNIVGKVSEGWVFFHCLQYACPNS